MSVVHGFKEVSPISSPSTRGFRLAPEAFRPPMAQCEPKFLPLSSGQATTSWYSPKAEDWGRQYADLSLMRFMCEHGLMHLTGECWLGALMNFRHHMVVRHSHSGAKSAWYFPLRHISGSCCLLWPAALEQVPGLDAQYLVPKNCDLPRIQDMLILVVDLSKWEAWLFEWRAPHWQAKEWPSASELWFTWSVRAVPVCPPHELVASMRREGLLRLGGALPPAPRRPSAH